MKRKSNSKIIFYIFLSLFSVLLNGCSMFGARTVEEVPYTVEMKNGSFEIRSYPGTILAQTTNQGSYRKSQRESFRLLFNYISGENVSDKKVPMTAPVTQTQNSKKIPMTAPVFQESQSGGWTMAFAMPAKYQNVSELPEPVDPRVKIIKRPKALYAVLTFSWFAGEEKIKSKTQELKNNLGKLGSYNIVSGPVYAGYNPPWTLPFMRRHEVMVKVTKK